MLGDAVVNIQHGPPSSSSPSFSPSPSPTPKRNRQRTRLMYASMRGDLARATWLLKRGARPGLQQDDGWDALSYACFHGHADVARLLVAKGADVRARDKNGTVALVWAAQNSHLVKFLLSKGADAGAVDANGVTSTIAASVKGHPDVVRELCLAGANPSVANKWEPGRRRSCGRDDGAHVGGPRGARPSNGEWPPAARAGKRWVLVV
jgi:hypothetical protein